MGSAYVHVEWFGGEVGCMYMSFVLCCGRQWFLKSERECRLRWRGAKNRCALEPYRDWFFEWALCHQADLWFRWRDQAIVEHSLPDCLLIRRQRGRIRSRWTIEKEIRKIVFAKFICEPNDDITSEVNEKIKSLPENFDIKHFRFTDTSLNNTNNIFFGFYEFLYRYI